MPEKKKTLFCNRSPVCYAISRKKEICKRHLKDLLGSERFARTRSGERLPNLVAAYSSHLIKRGPGVDPRLQENKAVNIKLACARINGIVIHPGEVFSFCRTVGKTSRRRGYREGRVIEAKRLIAGTGGGLCNLGNTIHRLVLHSPLTVTEFHKHSDALAPDEGPRVPFSAGTSVCYNYIDYRFQNTTDQDVQLLVWCQDGELRGELRSQRPFPNTYELVEEDHCFREEEGVFYRCSRIYRLVKDRATGALVEKELILDNHSEVMYDYALIPREQIRA